MRNTILELLKKVNRAGVEDLITFLMESDFFTAPASTKYHGNHDEGLAAHSLNVFKTFERKVKGYKLIVPEESVIIAGLLHDVCKVNFYAKEQKWRKDENNKWESYESFGVKDEFPFGHGEKSVTILQDFIKLTDQEKMLIRWHMGAWEPQESRAKMSEAMDIYPEIVLLQTSDQEVSRLIDIKIDITKGDNNNGK